MSQRTEPTDASPEPHDRDNPGKPLQGGTGTGRNQAVSPQLGERTADPQQNQDGGGMASTGGRTGTAGGTGSNERAARQEQARGGQMGPSD